MNKKSVLKLLKKFKETGEVKIPLEKISERTLVVALSSCLREMGEYYKKLSRDLLFEKDTITDEEKSRFVEAAEDLQILGEVLIELNKKAVDTNKK